MGGVIPWSRVRAVDDRPPGIDLSPIVHILLITDGTITPLLEACTGEPMHAVRLSQTVEPCGRCDPQLELDARQPVLRRTVLVQGRRSGIDYLYAESVIALERISARLRDELLLTDHPIGTMLRDHRVETFKEVLVSGHEPAGPSAAHFAVTHLPSALREAPDHAGDRAVLAARVRPRRRGPGGTPPPRSGSGCSRGGGGRTPVTERRSGGRPQHVVVVGAGIGGLTAALSLHAAGIEVEVLELAREIRPLGVGINILPSAVRELVELGLGDVLAATAVPTRELVYHDRFGTRIWSEPRGAAAGYRWPQYSVHRGELQRLLLDAVHHRLGADAVRCGMAFERFEQTGRQVRLEVRDRATGRTIARDADLLVGADGIHSAVRGQLHPEEGLPIWNGIHMWRGVTEAEPFLGGRTMIMAGSNRRAKFVAYPISERGRAAVNWVAEVRLGEGESVAPEDWQREARVDDVLPHFSRWRFDWLDVPGLIRGAPTIWEYPMVDRDPLPHWGEGRVTLLGDAAHPMYPIGSNGGSQAITDARVLAWNLVHADDPAAGRAAYEAARCEPTAAIVLANRRMGPERVLAIVEERAPDGFVRIEDVMGSDEMEAIVRAYQRTAGFDAAGLNTARSWNSPPPSSPVAL
jgi:2-polyprenyl-6-methoxyphenol hydroxylase-like FAD-dependent oxidoreductase/chorismate-pyruvate lyase